MIGIKTGSIEITSGQCASANVKQILAETPESNKL